MKIALTGATGFIGSHVLTELRLHGHDVTALVRDEVQAQTVAARGATAAVDRPLRSAGGREPLSGADGAVHTASPGDATSAELDSAVVDAAIGAFTGTGRPHAQISGLWIYGANSSVREDSPFNAPPLVSWKLPIQARLLDASDMRASWSSQASRTGTAAEGFPGCCSARLATTTAT